MAEMATVAMLVEPGKFEFREYPIPEINDDEMLVKVEGCGVCGTDGHEYKRDPFGLCAKGVVLGHEGSGEIVKIGKNIKTDSQGRAVGLGDKIVTCIIPCGHCPACKNTPARTSLCENVGVYGLFPDDEVHLNGYFGTYLKIRKGSTFFNVTGMTLDQRMLIEPAAGVENIIAVDGNDSRLEKAKEFGASKTFNFTKYAKFEDMLAEIKAATDGLGAEFVFQCTGVPAAHANALKMVRRGGGFCEVGFFLDGGNAPINPHFDFCNKEISLVGSWVYTPQDYPNTFDFLRRAKAIGLPVEQLVTHHFLLKDIDAALKANVSMAGIKIAVVTDPKDADQ